MTDEKLRLQKHPGHRIYSPVPASGVHAMIERYEPYAKVFSSQGQRTNVEAVMQLHPTGSFVHFTVYDALAARLAEAERLLALAKKGWTVGSAFAEESWMAAYESWLQRTADSARLAQGESDAAESR